jgi:2-aminoadipate transaminase
MQLDWSQRYSLAAGRMKTSAVREMLKLTDSRDVISFAGGLPAAEAFPVRAFQAAATKVLADAGPQALQYGTTEGYLPLRAMIARHTRRYGILVEPDNVLITTGSQQALDLIGKVFLDPGDRVVVERPTYLGALQAWNAYGARYLQISMDEEGLDTAELESALRGAPKFVYALPNFQNPTGATLSLRRRRRLVELAGRHGVPVVEDDPYGQLRFEGDHLPSLAAIDARARGTRSYDGNILYLSTFSKTLAPGLRVGWVIGSQEVIRKLVAAKQGADLHTSTFIQMLAYETARGGFLDTHVRNLRELYCARRDAMLAALERHLPEGVRWTRPLGGHFVWVTLPPKIDATELLHLMIVEHVAFVPGAAFYADTPMRNSLRLNFTSLSADRIDEGVRRLAFVLERMLEPVHA